MGVWNTRKGCGRFRGYWGGADSRRCQDTTKPEVASLPGQPVAAVACRAEASAKAGATAFLVIFRAQPKHVPSAAEGETRRQGSPAEPKPWRRSGEIGRGKHEI
jgi:hypothetical protein